MNSTFNSSNNPSNQGSALGINTPQGANNQISASSGVKNSLNSSLNFKNFKDNFQEEDFDDWINSYVCYPILLFNSLLPNTLPSLPHPINIQIVGFEGHSNSHYFKL